MMLFYNIFFNAVYIVFYLLVCYLPHKNQNSLRAEVGHHLPLSPQYLDECTIRICNVFLEWMSDLFIVQSQINLKKNVWIQKYVIGEKTV